MTIINVDYKDCKLEIDVFSCEVVKPNLAADNPFDFYGYTEIDFMIKSITAMAYDEDGNEIKEVTIDYDLKNHSDKEFSQMLWNDHGIDLVIDFDELHNVVEDYISEHGV